LIDALVALLEQPSDRDFSVEVVDPRGQQRRVALRVEPLPKPDGKALANRRLGLQLAPLDARAAAQLGVRAGFGVLILGASGAAARAVRRGDVLTRLGPYPVRSLDDVGLVLEKVQAGEQVPVQVARIARRAIYQTEFILVAK
jgi:S1-C subfamily serine protease